MRVRVTRTGRQAAIEQVDASTYTVVLAFSEGIVRTYAAYALTERQAYDACIMQVLVNHNEWTTVLEHPPLCHASWSVDWQDVRYSYSVITVSLLY